MKRVPSGRYTKEFREEAVKLVPEGGFSAYEASHRLSLPKSTLENWVRAFQKGTLSEVGKSQRPLTELEIEDMRFHRAWNRTVFTNTISEEGGAAS